MLGKEAKEGPVNLLLSEDRIGPNDGREVDGGGGSRFQVPDASCRSGKTKSLPAGGGFDSDVEV